MPGTVWMNVTSSGTNDSSTAPAVMSTAPLVTISLAPSRSYSPPATNDITVNMPISGRSDSPAVIGGLVEHLLEQLRQVEQRGEEHPRRAQQGDAGGGELGDADHLAGDEGVAAGPPFDQDEGDEGHAEAGEQRDDAGIAPAELGDLVEGDEEGDERHREGHDASDVDAVASVALRRAGGCTATSPARRRRRRAG